MFWAVGVLLITAGAGSVLSDTCGQSDFQACMREITETGVLSIASQEDMEEVCNSRRQAMRCASDYVQNCMGKGERDLYQASTGGKMKVLEDMCNEDTRIRKGFLKNMDCLAKIQDEIHFCNEKFQESQDAIAKASLLDRLKLFYGCCAFEWHRNCRAKAARMRCDEEAAEFIYYVSTVQTGQFQKHLCSSSYSSCHGLHGVENEDFESPPGAADDAIAVDPLSSGTNPLQRDCFRTVPLLLAWMLMMMIAFS